MAPATIENRPRRRPADPWADIETLAELLDRLGNVPPERVRLHPHPGTATEADVVRARQSTEKWRCELIDGVLVEKPMATREALLAGLIVHYLWDFLDSHDLGLALGADGLVRLFPGRVRIPDASFFSWNSLPDGELPDDPIANIVPDLAIEVLSKTKTRREIERTLDDYFQSGVRLVWVIDPKTESAAVYSSRDSVTMVKKNGMLGGGIVLPGFALSLKKLFARRGKK